jgi:hypothetical protein
VVSLGNNPFSHLFLWFFGKHPRKPTEIWIFFNLNFQLENYFPSIKMLSEDLLSGVELGLSDVFSINLLKYADKIDSFELRLIGAVIGFSQYYLFSFDLANGSKSKRNFYWDITSDIFVAISGMFL